MPSECRPASSAVARAHASERQQNDCLRQARRPGSVLHSLRSEVRSLVTVPKRLNP
jgi:hypothetical protein